LPKPSFFIDIDGVLYGGSAPVAKGPGVLNYLRKRGFGFLLVTNTSRMSQSQIRDKLTDLGYQIGLDEIFPVSLAAVEYLSSGFGHARCFLIGDPSLEMLLTEFGHSVVRHETPVDAVVMGQCMWPDFGEIDIARRLVNDGAEPIALHRDPTWPDGNVTRIGLGPMVAALELVISQPVTLIGKPERTFFDAALARTGFERSQTVMIGDSLSSDIAGAIDAGLKSLLVRTGNSISDPIPPGCDGELPSIADLPEWCEAQLDC
jgi:NagD protein